MNFTDEHRGRHKRSDSGLSPQRSLMHYPIFDLDNPAGGSPRVLPLHTGLVWMSQPADELKRTNGRTSYEAAY